jgi:hypothetical protein
MKRAIGALLPQLKPEANKSRQTKLSSSVELLRLHLL